MSRQRKRRVSERQADVALGVALILACVGIFAIVRWTAAFCAMIFTGAMFQW